MSIPPATHSGISGAGSLDPSGTPALDRPHRPAPSRRTPALVRSLTILVPALLVFGAEIVRHEWLHDVLPVMLGNVVTAAVALGISLLIFLPLYRRLDAADARLRRLAIERAVTNERERIARELHEGIAQALFFLNVEAQTLERSLGEVDRTDPVLRTVREIADTIKETGRRVRDTIFDLRTAREPDQPLAAWLREYAQRWSDIHNIAAGVEERATPPALPVERELHAMAIVREALHNVAKHAQARTVTITLTAAEAALEISIFDDGRGLPDPVAGPAQGRYGLAAMREHAAAGGGTVSVTSLPGGGTAVVLSLQLAAATAP